MVLVIVLGKGFVFIFYYLLAVGKKSLNFLAVKMFAMNPSGAENFIFFSTIKNSTEFNFPGCLV